MHLYLLLAPVLAYTARYDYKRSFKYPFLLQDKMPHFTLNNTQPSDKFIRLTHSVPHQRASITLDDPLNYPEFLIEFSFSCFGRMMFGDDGFALSITRDHAPGDFYGMDAAFDGLAIIFDNSDQEQNRLNPVIYAIDGNGEAKTRPNYLWADGHLGLCYRDYRNTPGPVHARLVYENGKLSLDIDLRQKGKSYTTCFSIPYQFKPEQYLMISGSTANSPDDHEFYHLSTYELNPPAKQKVDRPFEKKDIQDGHKFKMNTRMEEEMKKVHEADMKQFQDRVAEPVFQDMLDPVSVRRIMENQLHIIESLEQIQDKVAKVPSGGATSESGRPGTPAVDTSHLATQSQLDEMRRKLDDLATKLSQLTDSQNGILSLSVKLSSFMEDVLSQLHAKVDSTHQAVNDRSNDQTMTRAIWAFALLSGFGILTWTLSVAFRASKKEQKKFI